MDNTYNIIDELIPDNMFGVDLYHYTSADGLLGIFEKNKIRCTQIFYLNDLEENLNGWKIFFKVLDSYKKDHLRASLFKDEVHKVLSKWKEINFNELSNADFKKIDIADFYSFVFSMSQVDDDLNQWRSYTPESFGFSVHFNFNKDFINNQSILRDRDAIQDKLELPNCKIFIRKCVYQERDKEDIMGRLLDYHFTKFENEEDNWVADLFFNILTLSLFFKNQKFIELKINESLEITHLNGNIEEVGNCFLRCNKKIEYISLPLLKKVGDHFLSNNKSLESISLPLLKEVGNNFLFYNEKINKQ